MSVPAWSLIAPSAVAGSALVWQGITWRFNRRDKARERVIEKESADAATKNADAAMLNTLLSNYRAELTACSEQRQQAERAVRDMTERLGQIETRAATAQREHEHEIQRLMATVTQLRTDVGDHATELAAQSAAHDEAFRRLREDHSRELAAKDQQIAALQSQIDVLRQRVGEAGTVMSDTGKARE